jgi:integrase
MPNPDKGDKLVGDERGLYLRLYASGRRTWLFRSRVGGGWKTQNLGEWPGVSLAEARIKASALSGRQLPDAVKFGDLMDEWFRVRVEPTYKVTKNIEVYVAHAKRFAGPDRLTQLTTKRLSDLLRTYAERAPVSANRCLSNWKLALDYAVERGYIERNPLGRTTAKSVGGNETTRNRVLTDDEIRALWIDPHPHAPLLRALLLTGLRISEGQHAQHEHIEGDILHVRENKSDRPHWVYITPLLREQITSTEGSLFDERSNTAVQARLKRIGVGWTPHDLRRTFATRLADLGVEPYIIEKMLNHAMSGVMGIYNRHDYKQERIAASSAWAEEIKRITAT